MVTTVIRRERTKDNKAVLESLTFVIDNLRNQHHCKREKQNEETGS